MARLVEFGVRFGVNWVNEIAVTWRGEATACLHCP